MFFFSKQKTAYDVRISDWSSYVCSADLERPALRPRLRRPGPAVEPCHRGAGDVAGGQSLLRALSAADRRRRRAAAGARQRAAEERLPCKADRRRVDRHHEPHRAAGGLRCRRAERSEEHTSELQSLIRISYAVFCLKKK